MSFVAKNLEGVRTRISESARACGRDCGEIRLVAVTKTFPPDVIAQAIESGQTRFGENRVQEAEPKIHSLRGHPELEWHLVGHLQTNKAKRAAELFQVFHSVDSPKLAHKLSEAAESLDKVLSVLVQVDLGEEESKFGLHRTEVRGLVAAMLELPGLRLDGLMTIPPFFDDPERTRPFFRELRQLRDSLESEHPGCLGTRQLSMGMSHDFEVAIQEGATLVRIGTAIFGARVHG